ncbi:acyloxyacyl hydrolase [Aequorivita marisscotiae]|uniref:Acyloxyacyl hydrolase n=1 Tax=Aequorivita marisscotiae TaxID=3040348 RepID=A0ABY8KUY5_9FLAO|nr:acyloxyacyl hydrolase [Aequorivita sp. Ant34-E75]WGF92878.1 acyloxyacyl hydrolase [Aequorivita sp. Ant34-E75]
MKHLLSSFVAILFCFPLFSQEKESKPISLEAEVFYGSILEHNPDIQHLITGHPTGLIFALNRKTFGFKEWERRYNYPDWGFTGAYQNLHNEFLGNAFSAYGHLNFYFLKRNLMIRVGQGVAFATNPFDPSTNFRNNAYGTHFLSSTLLKASFIRENIWKGLGFQTGVTIIHYSNANLKAPNNSTNTLAVNAGVIYQLDYKELPEYIVKEDSLSRTHSERFKYNFAIRSGLNESDVVGLGQEPFVVLSAFVDKRINYKSSFTAGIDIFYAVFLKELIKYRSIAYHEDNITGDEDYKRVGIFAGHEWRFNKVAFVSQLGYYIYYPYEFENRVYNRLGLKRYFFNDTVFAAVTVHAHWAKAEAVEFGIGYRL